MLGILLLILCLVYGWTLLRLLPVKLSLPETAASSLAIGILIGSWTILVPVLLIGFKFGIATGILLMVLTVFFSWRHSRLVTVF